MPEYIKRMSAMTICERYSQHCFETNDNRGQDIADRIFDEITDIPTVDVVEVVRCVQCGNYCKNTGECNLYGRHPNENDFCSSGIKRSDTK